MGYYTPAEVAVHNTHTDCWVSFLGRVVDLTKLVQENEGILTQPIVAAAGTDISHWFDPKTGDVRYHVWAALEAICSGGLCAAAGLSSAARDQRLSDRCLGPARRHQVRTYIDPVTGTRAYYTPQGRFLHVLPNAPVTDQVWLAEAVAPQNEGL
jgi:hypothetical protein